MSAAPPAIPELSAVDEAIAASASPDTGPLTLDPGRVRATPLAELHAQLCRATDPPGLARAFAGALARIGRAQLEHFPENLFWDFDYLAATTLEDARSAADAVAHVEQVATLCVELCRTFGCASPIRFRYVHDFTYGFDWQRWAAADPANNGHIGPFDLPFLRRVMARGEELTALAAADDPAFPRLPSGDAWRNPFGFSRRPEHEIALHRALADRGEVPVFAWRCDAVPSFSRAYTRLRVERARALGLPPAR